MSTELTHLPGDENKQEKTSLGEKGNAAGENIHVSQPHIDRPEGPFEHSGETSGWTKEEEEEKQQEQ